VTLHQGSRVPDPAPISEPPTLALHKPRLVGVDVARGLALLGMLAVHVFPLFNGDDEPTMATTLAAGRSAATFVLVAGVGVAFLAGGRRPVRGSDRRGVAAGLAVRAVLIGLLGLILGLLSDYNDVSGILPYYGLFFLLAIPLLWARPEVLAGLAAATMVLGPLLLVSTLDVDWPTPGLDADPVPETLLEDPLGLLTLLSVTGEYPAVVYLAYLCAGLAIGRLDLSSRRVAGWLLGAGAGLAVAAQLAGLALLRPLGGLAVLVAEVDSDDSRSEIVRKLLWDPDRSSSSWYLALPAPHSHSIVDVAHTLGSAMAVLGAALLVTRVPAIARLLRPLAAAGSMALTLYSAHLVVLATGLLEDRPGLLYLLMVVGALWFASAWQTGIGQGPLERIVSRAAGAARRAVSGTAHSGTAR
jgi:uncharacterized membrane protein